MASPDSIEEQERLVRRERQRVHHEAQNGAYSHRHSSHIPLENWRRCPIPVEGAVWHVNSPGCGGSGTRPGTPDELRCAQFMYPEYFEDGHFSLAQRERELAATKEAVESALKLLDQRERAAAKKRA